ncbi:DedA family protein [Humidisolicoccus flavus]|uniref:DedA family protein n=1 Tax=Humidisolicoccus flavus TaxID=3111414 RepID=UPI003244D1FD
MNEIIDWLLDAVQSVDPVLRTIIAGIAIALETSVLLGMIVPGDTVVIVAATGIEDVGQWAWLVATIIVGSLLGETFGFWIGRLLGPRAKPWLDRRFPKTAQQWDRAQAFLNRRGGIAIFLSRFLPVLHSLVPMIVGTTKITYRRFLTWTIPACIIWSLAYASAGWAAAGSYRELSERLHSAGYFFVAAIALFLLLVWLVKRWLHKREIGRFGDDHESPAGASTEPSSN